MMKRKTKVSLTWALLVIAVAAMGTNAWATLVFTGGGPNYVPAGDNANMYASLDSLVYMQEPTAILATAYVFETSEFNVSDGQVDKIRSYDDAIINITGGDVSSLVAVCDSVVNIYGVFDSYGEVTDLSGEITGLIGNVNRTIQFEQDENATIILHETGIPEPASILALGLGSLLIRKKRQA